MTSSPSDPVIKDVVGFLMLGSHNLLSLEGAVIVLFCIGVQLSGTRACRYSWWCRSLCGLTAQSATQNGISASHCRQTAHSPCLLPAHYRVSPLVLALLVGFTVSLIHVAKIELNKRKLSTA